MPRRLLAIPLIAVLAVSGGCSADGPASADVTIGPAPVTFRVEVAQTGEQQQHGLSGRSELSEGTGMLFQFGSRSEQQVWMAGMTFPLDIAWIADGQVLATDTLTPCAEADESRCPRWTSPSPVDALLEVPAKSLRSVVPGMPVTVQEGHR